MSEPTLFRVGSACLIVGSLMAIVVNALHPRTADIGNPQALVQLAASSDLWVADHLGILVAVLLAVSGLAAVYRSLTGEAATALGRLGFGASIVSAAIFSVLLAIDGLAQKALANAWAAAPAAEQATAFRVAESVGVVSLALFSVVIIVFFGATFLLYGLAVASSDVYPTWLGRLAVALGAASILLGFAQATQGPSHLLTNIVFPIVSGLETLWALVIGVLLWRRVTAAAPAQRPSRI